ncbi:MAG: hypothetical protein K9H25_19920 [Rhodospirillum sp.]|nr:hypothetical protein [Rhodospirillum sp.]MCF8492177.1 hypothetical protein [Rhodospirillum sp.]MCF8499531.1 hypothetical protein [Rhodospirillum sp.]
METRGPFFPEPDPPLSTVQREIPTDQWLTPDSTRYNVPICFRLDGTLDVAALRSALRTMVARHEILRTAYQDDGHTIIQSVVSQADGFCDIPRQVTLPDHRSVPRACAEKAEHVFRSMVGSSSSGHPAKRQGSILASYAGLPSCRGRRMVGPFTPRRTRRGLRLGACMSRGSVFRGLWRAAHPARAVRNSYDRRLLYQHGRHLPEHARADAPRYLSGQSPRLCP